MIEVAFQVRPAVPKDQHQIANLMFFESHVHRHLDWRAPLEWLGSPNFWVLEENERILAALACPQDLQEVAWVRLFVHANRIPLADAWETLWNKARAELMQQGQTTFAAVIAMHAWMKPTLEKSGFSRTQEILMLEWTSDRFSEPSSLSEITLRSMTPEDLLPVAEVDAAAFTPIWQNSLDALDKALPQAIVATVAEDALGVAGYQISTGNPFGAHLARLAVRPDAQGRGLGTFILRDLFQRLGNQHIKRLTVNTQDDNRASLALYQKMGFTLTGEHFPVFCFQMK